MFGSDRSLTLGHGWVLPFPLSTPSFAYALLSSTLIATSLLIIVYPPTLILVLALSLLVSVVAGSGFVPKHWLNAAKDLVRELTP